MIAIVVALGIAWYFLRVVWRRLRPLTLTRKDRAQIRAFVEALDSCQDPGTVAKAEQEKADRERGQSS